MTALARAQTVPALLRALTESDPGRPRLTWYDDADGPTRGERIELSARVLANWVAKAASLLAEELDVEPGDSVVIALPTHWRAVYWALAAWSVGAEVVAGGETSVEDISGARVVVTDDPAAVPPGPTVVAVTLPALARRWQGPMLPSGAVDEAATVTGQPDVFEALDPVDGSAPALRVPGGATVAYDDLLPRARAVAAARGWTDAARVLTSSGIADAVTGLLAPLVTDGSVVLVRDPDPGAIDERRAAERITDRAQA